MAQTDVTARKPRLEWLDALRGFTMILVVANHVNQLGFEHYYKYSSSLPILMLFRMPLFFFISGFLAYKAAQVWSLGTLKSLLLKKLRVQVVPTLVFFTLFIAVTYKTFGASWLSHWNTPTKDGYWFTIVLLYMFVIYYIFAYVESKLKLGSWIPITVLFVLSLCAYETCYLPRYFSWAMGYRGELNHFVLNSSLRQLMFFFPFFVFGNMVHRFWDGAQRVMDAKWFYPLVIVVAVWSTMDILKWHMLRMEWAIVPQTLSKFTLLLIVFMYFRHYHQYFTKFTVIGRSLQYIGRRTLDIYLLHFFFMPQLPEVGAFFKATHVHNFVLDTTLSVVFGLIVIGFSIVTSNILRISPFFKKYLFGRESS